MAMPRLHPPHAHLFAYSLSSLPEAHAAAVQAHLRTCRRCPVQLEQMHTDLALVALALRPVPAPALLKESLLHSLSEIHRLYSAAGPIAELLQVPLPQAHAVLDRLDAAAHWRQLHKFWISWLPDVAGRQALMARVPAGVRLRPGLLAQAPADGGASDKLHHVMVLQGSGRDSAGQLWYAGDSRAQVAMESLLAHPGPDLIALIIRQRPRQAAASGARPSVRAAAAPGRGGGGGDDRHAPAGEHPA